MKLKTLALSILLMTSAWGDTSSIKLLELIAPALKDHGWVEARLESGDWASFSKNGAHLSLKPWDGSYRGEKWKMGARTARFTLNDGTCTLSSDEGWSIEGKGLENPARELAVVATALSTDGSLNRVIGASTKGRPIKTIQLGLGLKRVLYFGVFHGDEPAGEVALHQLTKYLMRTPSALSKSSVLICPVLNPDALAAGTRENANLVDINRNFPAKNWSGESKGKRYWGGPSAGSEQETKIVMKMIEEFKPDAIISIHAPLHNVNYDGPAAELAKRMSQLNGYPVEPDIGYPTPGSFGTYYGRERSIAVITLEFPEGDGETLWLKNKEALLEAIRYVVNP